MAQCPFCKNHNVPTCDNCGTRVRFDKRCSKCGIFASDIILCQCGHFYDGNVVEKRETRQNCLVGCALLLIILFVIGIVGCSTINSAIVADIPKNIAVQQYTANNLAKEVLSDLRVWLDSPESIPEDVTNTTHTKIQDITRHLTVVRNWMLVDGVDKKVSQTVIALLVAWRDYVDAEFCVGEKAWLDQSVPMSADDNSAWFQVFLRMESLHKKILVWMEHKGVIDA